MEMRTCVNCGPLPLDKWRQVKKGAGTTYRCIKCTHDANSRSYFKHKAKRQKKVQDWVVQNRERKLATDKAWREANAVPRRQYMREYLREVRDRVLRHYGGEDPRCACCGEGENVFLCLDHINGGGNKHRAEAGEGSSFFQWVIRNGFPDGFRVLCHNCNFAYRMFGVCPHTA